MKACNPQAGLSILFRQENHMRGLDALWPMADKSEAEIIQMIREECKTDTITVASRGTYHFANDGFKVMDE